MNASIQWDHGTRNRKAGSRPAKRKVAGKEPGASTLSVRLAGLYPRAISRMYSNEASRGGRVRRPCPCR